MQQNLTGFRKMAEPLAKPHHIMSFLHLFRQTHVGDDFGRRLLEKLRSEYHDPLIVLEGGRLVLTQVGRELLALAIRLSALAEKTETPADVLTVEADSLLAECLLPQAFVTFLVLWASMVQPRICPMQYGRTRKNIQDGTTALGVGLSGESVSSAEMLGPKVSWVLVPPKNHRLAGTHEPISAEDLTINDRVFIPELGADWPGMDGILKSVPNFNRIVCDATLGIRLAMAGLGAAIVPDLLPEGEFACKRVIQGIAPVQPRFVFPRRGFDGLTEPEQSLVEQIRQVAEARCKQAAKPETAESAAEDVIEALVEETVTPLEEVLS